MGGTRILGRTNLRRVHSLLVEDAKAQGRSPPGINIMEAKDRILDKDRFLIFRRPLCILRMDIRGLHHFHPRLHRLPGCILDLI